MDVTGDVRSHLDDSSNDEVMDEHLPDSNIKVSKCFDAHCVIFLEYAVCSMTLVTADFLYLGQSDIC